MTRTHFPADPTHREPAGHSVTDGQSADSLTRLAPTVGSQRLQPPASSQFSVKQENELPALKKITMNFYLCSMEFLQIKARRWVAILLTENQLTWHRLAEGAAIRKR